MLDILFLGVSLPAWLVVIALTAAACAVTAVLSRGRVMKRLRAAKVVGLPKPEGVLDDSAPAAPAPAGLSAPPVARRLTRGGQTPAWAQKARDEQLYNGR